MNPLSAQEIKTLLEAQGTPCVSIFLSTHRKAGPEMQQNLMRLRNQLREAEQMLRAREMDSVQIKALWRPVETFLNEQENWSHPQDGLAIFRSPDLFYAYQLPYSVKEQTVVGNHFYLKPLLPFLINEKPFYILALSQNEVRFFEATHYQITQQTLPSSVPTNLDESIKGHRAENDIESHSSASGATFGKGGRRPAIFHGQGVGHDDEKMHLLRYFQEIDRGLHEFFHDKTAPLLLAGVEFLLPIYRKSNTYPYLLPKGVAGNPDQQKGRDETTLRNQAWQLVEAFLLKDRQEALAQFEEGRGTDRASDNVSEIVPAAYEGRVKALFLAVDQEEWGTYEPATYTVHVHETSQAGDDDLLEVAARQTLLHNGSLYAMKRENMPGQTLLAAVYRY